MLRAIDTHAHLDFPAFDQDRTELLDDLNEQAIGVINVATTAESVETIQRYNRENIWSTVGIHPTEITAQTILELPALIERWQEMIKAENSGIVAIGEIGLDYYRLEQETDVSKQKAVLKQLLTLAQEVKLPVIFHCREAYGDLVTILQDYSGIKGIVHCFSGTPEQAVAFKELGLNLSFTGMITYPKNEAVRQIAKSQGLTDLVLETDSPFLALQEKRGSRNDPRAVLNLAQFYAELFDTSVEQILTVTTQNAQRIFRLDEGSN